MFGLQSHLIFPTHVVPAPGPLPKGAVRLTIETPDGHKLHGVHIRPSQPGARPSTLIIAFAGNAWNSEDAVDYLHQVYPAADILGFHYRGYRPSTGKPSARALFADAPLIYDFATSHVEPDKVVAVGLSIGSAVAAHLSATRELDGLILVTPFDSLKQVAADQYPMLPIAWLFEHEMNSADALKNSRVPTAIIAAEHDEVIPRPRTDALRERVQRLVFDQVIKGAGHNDIYHRSQFQQAMRDALTAVSR